MGCDELRQPRWVRFYSSRCRTRIAPILLALQLHPAYIMHLMAHGYHVVDEDVFNPS